MNKRFFLSAFIVLYFIADAFAQASAPDSAWIYSYATTERGGRNGLHFAWSLDKEKWHAIGPEHSFMRCDYGTWSTEKRMLAPFLFQDNQGFWHCVWSVNEYDGAFACAMSENLIDWRPQSYPVVNPDKNCLMPEISYDNVKGKFIISWLSGDDNNQSFYHVTTKDFKHYSDAQSVRKDERINLRRKIQIDGNLEIGTVHYVTWQLIRDLIDTQKLEAYNNQLDHETTDDDPVRFKDLDNVNATVFVDGKDTKKISDKLIGIFFEDINYAADGGLYAELIQNRGFEYDPHDKKGLDPDWNSLKAWNISGSSSSFTIETDLPLHKNNPHYAVLNVRKLGAGLANEGFDGIPVIENDKYEFSMFAFNPDGINKQVFVRLVGNTGEVYGEASINVTSSEWKKYKKTIKADQTIPDAHLELVPRTTGRIAFDMVSLFPQKTFKGRKNGLRADLAKVLADMHPRFIRFPGGCVAHGDGLGNMYHWKNTIGPLETRKPQRNLWGYHQSVGMGYFEYFQFCEDIGAEPIPIVAAGVPCQNSSDGGAGQQCGIPLDEMDDYVQDVLDLIEWANGDITTTWGKKRAEAGHPNPFNLKYIGVGNEDLITEIFKERFIMIYNAIREKYPEIIVIGTVGPFYKGSDYEEGWRFAAEQKLSIVDEHYYRPPGWFIHNQDYYDRYNRSKSKVYLGEYAAHLPGRPNNIETALSEALYLTAIERNGDVVRMASYAPLLAKEGHTQWNPDLIYFDNTDVRPTVGYYVQKLYGQNSGDIYLSSFVSLSENRNAVRRRMAVSAVKDSESKDVILKLVNMLPVEVNAKINLKDVGKVQSKAVQTILSGHPDDRDVKPVSSEIRVSNDFQCTLKGYSFTLIRLQMVDK